MVSTSKILTVSYGTFSCTLEGFDDSFETMKAIAEYFRDLAADDRYFGAEPPTPDAEMLARIAEREIARRVEAREEKGGIVLRASEAAEPAAPALAAAPLAAAAAQEAEDTATDEERVAPGSDASAGDAVIEDVAEDDDVTEEAVDRVEAVTAEAGPAVATEEPAVEIAAEAEVAEAAEDAIVDDMPAEETVAETAPEAMAAPQADEEVDAFAEAGFAEVEEIAPQIAPVDENSIAAKLQRIRAVVSRNAAAGSEYSEDEHAENFVTEDSSALEAVLAEGSDADAPADVAEDDDTTLADILAETRIEEEAVAEEAPAFEDDSQTPEEMLEEIAPEAEEPVAGFAEDQEDEPEATTAEAPQEDAGAEDTAGFEMSAFIADAMTQDEGEAEEAAEIGPTETETLTLGAEDRVEELEETAEASDADEDEDDVASILDQLAGLSDDDAAEDAEGRDTPDAVEADATRTAEAEEEDDLDDILAGLDVDEDGDDWTEAAAEAQPEDAEPVAELPEADEDEMAEADAEAAPALRARVVKMKRADFEAAIAEGHLEEAEDDDWDEADDWSALDDSELSPEEEAELQAELAEVEAELDDEDALDDTAEDEVDSIFAEADDDTPDMHDRRRARDQLDEAASEKDMSRLMAKTISVMDEPETASRRSAIAHLRAAVAATRADKEAGVSKREDTISEAFREDLASVVRPRRPRAEGTGTARPTEPERPAPLKLVAEQRIDGPAAPQAPVRPRRVSMSEIRDEAPAAPVTEDDAESFADYVETTGAHDLAEILEAAASYLAFVEGRDQFSRPQLMTRARSVIGDEFSREDGLRSFGQLLRQGKIQKIKGGRFTVSEEIGFQPRERRAG